MAAVVVSAPRQFQRNGFANLFCGKIYQRDLIVEDRFAAIIRHAGFTSRFGEGDTKEPVMLPEPSPSIAPCGVVEMQFGGAALAPIVDSGAPRDP